MTTESCPGSEPVGCSPCAPTEPLATEEAAVLARGFHALGDPVRLRLLSMLAAAPAGEICVCELVGPLGKSQGTISHHLKILSEARLVRGERRGKWVWYSLEPGRLEELQGSITSRLGEAATVPPG